MRMLRTLSITVLLATHAHAVTIVSTDFNGRTVAGATASNLTYITNGVADPGDLTASHDLFDTSDAQNRIAVDRNLHNEGDWTLDVPLTVLGSDIELTTVTLDAFIFNNSGALQASQRDVDFRLELRDAGLSLLDSDTVSNIYANSGTAIQPQSVSFDLLGNTLSANTDYTLRLTSFGQGSGNNSGIDNFVVNGNIVVPEPASAACLVIGLAGLAARRRRVA